MIRVANVAAHRQTEQLAQEVIFQPGAGDLPLVEEIFRTDEADDGVDNKRIERPRYAVCPRFECKLIHALMRLSRESASLPGLEIHHIVADPGNIIPLSVVFENALAAF